MSLTMRRAFLPSGDANRGLRIWFYGFMVAVVGAVIGVIGWYIDERNVTLTGWAIGLVGVGVGGAGVVLGWLTTGRDAITGGVRLTWESTRRFWRSVGARRNRR
jgi:hypothetical protein